MVTVDCRPIWFILAFAKDTFENSSKVVDDVERLGRNLFLLVVQHNFPSDTNLIGFFSIKLHDEDETYDCSY